MRRAKNIFNEIKKVVLFQNNIRQNINNEKNFIPLGLKSIKK